MFRFIGLWIGVYVLVAKELGLYNFEGGVMLGKVMKRVIKVLYE